MYGTRHESLFVVILAIVFLIACGEKTVAQQTGVAVQLPTFSYFSVNTSVLVPDSGAGIAAAMQREAANRIMYGPWPNVAQGRAASTGGVTVHATVHDRKNEPGLLLSEDMADREARPAFSKRFDGAGESSAERADLSVAEIKARRSEARQAQQAEALRYFERGRTAEANGKFGVAAIYYRQAATRASGELRTAAVNRLKVVTKID